MRSQEQRVIESVRWCVEKALGNIETPEYFYIAFNFDPLDEGDLRTVRSGAIDGAMAVGSSEFIKLWWLGSGREAMFTMPGDAFLAANDARPIAYVDPESLLADGGRDLARLFDREKLSDTAHLVGQYMGRALKDDAELRRIVGLSPTSAAHEAIINATQPVLNPEEFDSASSVSELADSLLRAVELKKEKRQSTYYGFDQFLAAVADMGRDAYERWVRDAVTLMGQTYAVEGEWEVPAGKVVAPRGSELTIVLGDPGDDVLAVAREFGRYPSRDELDLDDPAHLKFLQVTSTNSWKQKLVREWLAVDALREELEGKYDVVVLTSHDLSQWKAKHAKDYR